MNDDDLAHVFTFGVLSGDFFDMIAQKSAILPWPIQLSTSMVAKKRTQPQTEQHNTQQPKWAAAALPSSGFSPLPPRIGQRHHQIMAPPHPMVPCKARAFGCALAAPLLLVWGVETQLIEKQRGGRGLELRWQPFGRETQQSTQSQRQR